MGDQADEFDRVFGGLDQVRELQERNQQLLGILDAKNEEIAQLQELAEAATELYADDAHAKKIVQLSKKNRNLNLALEKERALSVQLAGELRSAKAKLAAAGGSGNSAATEDAAREIVREAAQAAEAAEEEAAAWQERYKQASEKCIQAEAKAGMAKKEAEKMQRLLQREVGEGVDLAKVMDEGSGWRGRAQQISLLKDKLRDAQAGGGGGAQGPSATRAAAQHDANRKNLEGLKEKRKQDSDKLASDLAEAKGEMEKLRLKCDGATSRKKVLESEVKGLKDKIVVLLGKTENDDRLIGALRAELVDLKRSTARTAGSVETAPAYLDLKQQLKQREAQVQRQEMIIRTLEAQRQ